MRRIASRLPHVAAVLLLATGASAAEAIRIDGSSDAKATATFNRMVAAGDPARRQALLMAMIKINMDGVDSASEMLADPKLRNPSIANIRQRLDGMTADEILALADGIESTSVFIAGQEPGVPADLLQPLAQGPTAHDLAGTTWIVTSDINGHIRSSTYRLDADGSAHDLDQGLAAGPHRWEQSGDEVRIHVNDGFAVYRGRVEEGQLGGKAGNRNGSTWSWTATRAADDAVADGI